MRIVYIALLMCLVLSTFASALAQGGSTSATFVAAPTVQTTTTTTTAVSPCRTSDQLNSDIRACQGKGLDYITYEDQSRCKAVSCVEGSTTTCPAEAEVERTVANCPNSYAWTTDQQGCKIKYCMSTTTCPTDEELARRVANCPDAYAWTTDQQGCKVNYCKPTIACPNEEGAMRNVANCPNAYSWTTDQNGCKMPYCTPTAICPDNVEEQMKKCKAAQLDYEVYGDANGCKQVRCRNDDKVECKKYVQNGCVIISCNDGYILNLCDYCQPTCKVYTDNFGCTVKDCGNGQESIACPTTSGGVAPPTQVTTATQITTEAPKPVPTTATAPTQTEPGKPKGTASDVAGCVLMESEKYNKIDDEVTWNKCKVKYSINAEEEGKVARVMKCIIEEKKGGAEIDDEITWGKCKGQYLAGETGLSPQPDAPGMAAEGSAKAPPAGFWGWLKGIFK
jgi:hypothetical protein